jgi:hypothetical protein
MTPNQKGLLVSAIALGAVGLAYYFLIHKKSNGSGDSTSSDDATNFNDLQSNIGSTTKADVLSVKFNEGKNTADFYKNHRLVIGKFGTQGYIAKGSYSDGGKSIKLDNGKEINSGSVWNNLLQTIK